MKRTLGFIEALRGMTSIIIVAFHLITVAHLKVLGSEFIELGKFGTVLFFIISGFIIYLSMENKVGGIFEFYIKRFFRIAPLFYFVICIYIYIFPGFASTVPSIKSIILNIIFAFNFYPQFFYSIVGAGWTLGVEIPFYFFAPFIFILINSLRRAIIFFGSTAIMAYAFAMWAHMIATPTQISDYVYMSFFTQLPIFAIGIVCFFIYRDIIPKTSHKKEIAFFLFSIFVLLVYAAGSRITLMPNLMRTFAFSALIMALALFPASIIVNKTTQFYGKISYSTYLIHPLVIYNLRPIYLSIYSYVSYSDSLAYAYCLVLTLAILTLIALASYNLIEVQGKRCGDWLITIINLHNF
jgi:peptidoglycan/LPS O-acetylase OafA/YrhL